MKTLLVLFVAFVAYQVFRSFVAGYRTFQQQGSVGRSFNDGFARALFQSMGHLAKVDGRVSEDEIRAARTVMQRLGLGQGDVRRAIDWFNEGKEPAFSLPQTMRQLRRVDARVREERSLFLRLVLEVSLAKAKLHQKERAAIWTMCQELGISRVELAQLEAMIRAQRGFRLGSWHAVTWQARPPQFPCRLSSRGFGTIRGAGAAIPCRCAPSALPSSFLKGSTRVSHRDCWRATWMHGYWYSRTCRHASRSARSSRAPMRRPQARGCVRSRGR